MNSPCLKRTFCAFLLALSFCWSRHANGQHNSQIFSASPIDDPTVAVNWERYYDHEGITEICRKLVKAFPHLIRMESIGESFQGKRLWALTVTDFGAGDPDAKPALYLDGIISHNGLQGSEYTLYTAWYLLESYGKDAFISQLLKEKTLYIIPLLYPDMRDKLMGTPEQRGPKGDNNPSDEDGDGLVDEDGPNDLNGDGFITLMRRKNKAGKYVVDKDLKHHLLLAPRGENGQFDLIGYEGHDNDGDGLVNEDPVGYLNPMTDWAWGWQPQYLQQGASLYPFSLPENRAAKEFVLRHPNIAAAQNFKFPIDFFYPETSGEGDTAPTDTSLVQLYASLETGYHQLLPHHFYALSNTLTPDIYGGQLHWFWQARGILPLQVELYRFAPETDDAKEEGDKPRKKRKSKEESWLGKEAFTPWTPYEHPTYGSIEIGGFKKDFFQNASDLSLSKEAHQVMIQTLYHLYQTPKLLIRKPSYSRLPNGNTEVFVTVVNLSKIPTHTPHDVSRKIERPDFVKLKDSTVVAGMLVTDKGKVIGKEQRLNPSRIEVPSIGAEDSVRVRWVTKSASPVLHFEVDSRKGGVVEKKF